MTSLTQPLRDEHAELFPHVDRIREIAEHIDRASDAEVRRDVDEVYDFLARHLIPHAQAEDAALYPAVQKTLGSPDATLTMSRDHVEVGRYVEELAALKAGIINGHLNSDQIRSLQRVLYGVYALVKVHFAKEEEIYLPLLDRTLSPEAARELFEKLEAAAGEAKHALPVA